MKKIINNAGNKVPKFFSICFFCLLLVGSISSSYAVPVQTIAQAIEVTGTVTDRITGEALPGVNIYIEGSNIGVISDIDGYYSIEVPGPSTIIVFSYMGYVVQKEVVGDRTIISVALEEEAKQIEEVVAIGYGTLRKRDITASISSVRSEDISNIPATSALESIKGLIPGVDISQTGGKPGQESSITIRGRRSITANKPPLVVVDGIPMSNGTETMSDIAPGDIESIEVLKDAAATAIYGARGANGVIMVTTKRGKVGKTTVSYEGYFGITSPMRLPDFMNAEEFADMRRESWRTNWNGTLYDDELIFSPAELAAMEKGVDTDWIDLMFNNGYRTNHNLSVNGGNEKTRFNISFGYFDEIGLVNAWYYNRISSRMNIDHTINDYLSVGASVLVSSSTQDIGTDATLVETYAINPFGEPYDSTGNLIFTPVDDGRRTNPLAEVEPGANINQTDVVRVLAPVYLEIKPVKGLSYRMNFGPDLRFSKFGLFSGQWTNRSFGVEGNNMGVFNNKTWKGYTFDNILTYNFSIGQVHDITISGIHSAQREKYEMLEISGTQMPNEKGIYYTISQAANIEFPKSDYIMQSMLSYMGRVIYSYKGKYLVQGTVRYDGSSRLVEGYKWDLFPGVSVGWRVSDEAFMNNISFVNDLKLRASYGSVGSSGVEPYETQGPLGQRYYAFGDDYSVNYPLENLTARALGWERSTTFDAGIDFGFWGSRVRGSVDYYYTRNSDLILQRALPITSGYTKSLENIGETMNQGVELSLSAGILQNSSGLNWIADLNLTHYQERILDLGGTEYVIDADGNWYFVDEEINIYYDYEKEGIWQADEEDIAKQVDNKKPGEIKVRDVDGDSLITDNDRVVYGRAPKFFGGFVNTFTFKGFDLSAFLFFKYGHSIKSEFNRNQNSLKGITNNLDVDYWLAPTYDEEGNMIDPGNPTNAYPRPDAGNEYAKSGTTLMYFDGSYIKLRNLTLGYTLPVSLTKRFKVSKLRVYVSGENLWLKSEYDLFDPENGSASIDDRDAPSPKTILAGINITF